MFEILEWKLTRSAMTGANIDPTRANVELIPIKEFLRTVGKISADQK